MIPGVVFAASIDGVMRAYDTRDGRTWAAPWTAALDMRRQKGGMFEYACQEGNYGLMNMLRASRLADQK